MDMKIETRRMSDWSRQQLLKKNDIGKTGKTEGKTMSETERQKVLADLRLAHGNRILAVRSAQ